MEYQHVACFDACVFSVFTVCPCACQLGITEGGGVGRTFDQRAQRRKDGHLETVFGDPPTTVPEGVACQSLSGN